MNVVAGTAALSARNITRMRRNPGTAIGTVVVPLLFLGLFHTVLARAMRSVGVDYAQYLPPAVTAQAMFFAAMSTAYYFTEDRGLGLFDRFRSLPVGRAAPVLARAVADLARASISLTVVTVAAMVALGFRFRVSALATLGYVAVSLGFAVSLTLVCAVLGLYAKSAESASSLVSLVHLPLLMLSSAFVAAESYPAWLRPVVRVSPVSAVVDALRALSSGGDTAGPVMVAAAWIVGVSAVFVVMAARRMRALR